MEKFNIIRHGYDPKEVNAFLDNVIAQVDKIVSDLKEKNNLITNLQKDNGTLLEQVNRYKLIEETMNKTIVAAQDSGEQIRRIAKQESDIIISEARNNANRIVSDALVRAEKQEFETAQLRKNIVIFKRRLHSTLEAIEAQVDDIETLDI